MLVLNSKVGKTLIIQSTPEVITQIQVLDTKGSTVTFKVETQSADKKLKTQPHTLERA